MDSIPFFLKKEAIVSIDTKPANEFLSYQFLPLDSSKLFYNVDVFNYEAVFEGMPAIVRPFIQQFGSILFLVFTILFVLGALTFRQSGRSLFSNFGYTFTLGGRNKTLYNEQLTTSDVWSHIFFVFQTIVFCSILFFDLTLRHANLQLHGNEYLFLFAQIMGAIFVFMFLRYVVYKVLGAIFLDTRTNIFLDTYSWVVYLTGIISFIPLLLYFYISEIRTYMLFVLFAVFVFGRIAVSVRSYALFVKSHIGILYFFVYLCGVEIMPYFLVYKAISFMI